MTLLVGFGIPVKVENQIQIKKNNHQAQTLEEYL